MCFPKFSDQLFPLVHSSHCWAKAFTLPHISVMAYGKGLHSSTHFCHGLPTSGHWSSIEVVQIVPPAFLGSARTTTTLIEGPRRDNCCPSFGGIRQICPAQSHFSLAVFIRPQVPGGSSISSFADSAYHENFIMNLAKSVHKRCAYQRTVSEQCNI